MVFHVEVNFSGFPFLAGFSQQDGDQAQEGCFVGKEAGHARAPAQFLIDAFQGGGGSHPALTSGGQGEDRQALRQVFLQPRRQLWRRRHISRDDFLEALLGRRTVGGDENTADGFGDTAR